MGVSNTKTWRAANEGVTTRDIKQVGSSLKKLATKVKDTKR